ncbi:hypothetical protein, conserved [Trypanosoma brucei gambiense DAL972]|uniref:RNA-editing substrate-binding complex 6 protein domain-containing protein n=1 Tax=Trypanosoma brucei gambiense (strain MHOM/CI/86/DAL972) TaxID=679716 RepID=D0AAR1_TRYB9|nr:hypothetical protein, conserved [Trypanosoma brucei gambiense DAL972]CBH18762.1 hypothetical protein, conserved [Trypanosoma brucei gambiense DAL972]|eukprot:XP_011781026.1 hypothetical protein, conserved [Trypanosoma brucei gambiense DAL972]
MLTRVIHDLYHLKKIHSVVLDEKLGHALKEKLTALELSVGPSPGPSALRRLLECLAYFQLEQSPVAAKAVALVRAELPRMTGGQLSRTIAACCMLGQNDISFSALPLLSEALPSMDSTGTVQLIDSLAAAGVRHEDTWSLLAEHCIRRMDGFTGQQLYRIIECFYERRVHYPDFYVVAERHICAQPSSYISMEHLSAVIECYRGLEMPVVSLLAASSARSAEGFESALAAMSPARARRDHRAEGGPSSLTAEAKGALNPSVVAAFVQSMLKAVQAADEVQLTDMLHKCEVKQVMHAEIMEAIALRLKGLHDAAPNVARTTALMRLMMRFEKREWFAAAAAPLCELMDACVEDALTVYGHRLLNLADGALKLFPADKQPTHFYTVLVRDMKFGDVTASVDVRRLPLVVGVMLALRAYGGPTLLEQHMPMISVAAANAPFRVQVELAAMLAPLPMAKKTFLPDLFTSLSSQKNWSRKLVAREAILLMEALTRSRLPFNDLLLVVVEFTRRNPSRFDAPELVNILLQCATLGFNDVEFYSATATHILEKAANATVHDLCMLMYAFTFVLKGVIRVVQQMMPRLRVSASHATARDIVLLLYSSVKLGITRHAEVTVPFCDRALNILPSFKGEELASCMGSLRALKLDHEELLSATAEVLGDELQRRESCNDTGRKETAAINASGTSGAAGAMLTDAQFISITSAIVQLRPALLRPEWHLPLQAICLHSLSGAGAAQTHLIAGTLAALTEAPCKQEHRELLLERANDVCERFASGIIAAEVVLALHTLMLQEGLSDEEVKEILSPTPLIAFAKSHHSSIISNTDTRDKLRGKGLLLLLSGVVPSSIQGSVITGGPFQELSLRESLLLQRKETRQTNASKDGPSSRRKTRGALKPTTLISSTKPKRVKDCMTDDGDDIRRRRRSSAVRDEDSNALSGDNDDVASRRGTADGSNKCYAGEPHKDVEEFHL